MSTHEIVHIEIPANNGKEASQFYTDAFGWKNTHAEAFDYWMFQPEGGPGGGFNQIGGQMDVKLGEVLVYVATDNIEDSLAKIESLGGKTLMPKSPITETTWFALFEDPTGNRMGLYQDETPTPA